MASIENNSANITRLAEKLKLIAGQLSGLEAQLFEQKKMYAILIERLDRTEKDSILEALKSRGSGPTAE